MFTFKNYNLIILSIFYSILSLSFISFGYPWNGIDPSYSYALSYANYNGLQFGKDIIFTYGPLFYILSPGLLQILEYSLLRNILITILFFVIFNYYYYYIFYFIFKKIKLKRVYKILASLLIFLMVHINFISFQYDIISVCLLVVYLLITDQLDKKSVHVFLLAILLAVLVLVKFSTIVIIFCLFLIYIMCGLFKKDLRYQIMLLFLFFCFVLLFWIFTGQNIINIINYFIYGFEFGRYFNSTMVTLGLYNTKEITIIGCWLLFFSVISFLVFLSYLNKNYKYFIFYILFCPFLYTCYKYMIVRLDIFHIIFAARPIFLFLLLNLVAFYQFNISSRNINKVIKVISVIYVIVLIGLFLIWSFKYESFLIVVYQSNLNKIPMLSFFSSSAAQKEFQIKTEKSKSYLKNYYKLNSKAIQAINNKTIDIFPNDLTIAYGYDLNFKPRPILQSITVWSNSLDNYNSSYFKEHLPEMLLFSLSSIDYRYPLFDEPKTFKEVLYNYKYKLNASDDYLLLEKNKKKKLDCNNIFTYECGAELGKVVWIPEGKAEYIFASIDIKESLLGKIQNFLLVSDRLFIQFVLDNGKITNPYRFLHTNANNGLLISEYIKNINDLQRLFSGEKNNNVFGFKIFSDGFSY